jgi:NTP pyrophosphatase (non-canonical NTP hydrolase)
MLMQLTVSTFRADCTDKEQALKVLEETNEAYAAWQQLAGLKTIVPMLVPSKELDDLIDSHREILADEIADTITACANLAERYGLDLQAALGRVERKNRERGRYGCKDR